MELKYNLSDIAPLSSISETFSHADKDYIFSHLMVNDKVQKWGGDVFRFDGLVLVMVIKGNLNLTINSERHHMTANCLTVLRPTDVIVSMSSPGDRAEVYMLFLSRNFIKGINFDVNIIRPSRFIDASPIVKYTRQEQKHLLNYLLLLHNCTLQNETGTHQLGVIARSIERNIVVALLYQIAYINEKSQFAYDDDKISMPMSRSRKYSYVQEFLQVLEKYYRQERNLAFYADKLCLSPKYLSLLVRDATGQSAAAIIDRYVVNEAKNMLRFSNDTIQQVAYKLNFPNQSAFGKYFKHLTGQSPSAFRAS